MRKTETDTSGSSHVRDGRSPETRVGAVRDAGQASRRFDSRCAGGDGGNQERTARRTSGRSNGGARNRRSWGRSARAASAAGRSGPRCPASGPRERVPATGGRAPPYPASSTRAASTSSDGWVSPCSQGRGGAIARRGRPRPGSPSVRGTWPSSGGASARPRRAGSVGGTDGLDLRHRHAVTCGGGDVNTGER